MEIKTLSEKLSVCRTDRPDEWTMDEFKRDAIKLEAVREERNEALTKLEAVEKQRPHWAKGYSTDGISAQVSISALLELWGLLSVSNQTDAVEKLQGLAAMESQEPVYFWKEIGETDWMECHKDWYLKCVDSPEHDTKLLYAKPVPDDKPAPSHWAIDNPGRADQYRCESLAVRDELGFPKESDEVSPRDLREAIQNLMKCKQATRITEQDAYDIILNFFWFMESYKNKDAKNPSVVEWHDSEGRELLNKLNADREAERFCDAHCTWRDHHPDCPSHESEQSSPPASDNEGE